MNFLMILFFKFEKISLASIYGQMLALVILSLWVFAIFHPPNIQYFTIWLAKPDMVS